MALIMHIILVPSIFALAYAILKEQKFHDLRYIHTHILYTAIFSYDWGMSWLPPLKGYDIMRIWNVETIPLPPQSLIPQGDMGTTYPEACPVYCWQRKYSESHKGVCQNSYLVVNTTVELFMQSGFGEMLMSRCMCDQIWWYSVDGR